MDAAGTIAAIATPPGEGGIGVVRVSGPLSGPIMRTLFRPATARASFESRRLYHGEIIEAQSGKPLDEVMAVFLKGPHSFTGEDTLEIYCHGGPLILSNVLREVFRAGAAPAPPGEFTKRAFLNNRLGLSQAEAVISLISAQTDEDLEVALSHLKGALQEKVGGLASRLIDLASGLEAAIDFPEDDTALPEPERLVAEVDKISADIRMLADTYHEGRIYRDGLSVVIAGKPNVGKSSILNRLVGEERAIVTHIPGTTRDLVREKVRIRGIPVELTDTAGIRATDDVIESKGVELVFRNLSTADLVIFVIDGSAPVAAQDREIARSLSGKPVITVINKSDLAQMADPADLDGLVPGLPFAVSAKMDIGMDALRDAIRERAAAAEPGVRQGVIIADARHRAALDKAAEALDRARDAIQRALPPELVIVDIRECLCALGEITGETVDAEILDRIFSKFCIGK